ncbi:HNH endonuclease [Phyllobacterium sp. LjRoot231]|uniref:HNH endonuclease n=1 Tax=Phyllobacterium sp. LjRoot231 TaxID=3342289 RepID=UPI003ECD0547
MNKGQTCKVETCGRQASCKGFCDPHYRRFKRHGDPLQGRVNKGFRLQWLSEQINFSSDECLLPPFQSDGKRHYWQFSLNGKFYGAHRWMCQATNGEPPTEKHHAAHSCGNGHLGCVNPKHLNWATPKENAADMIVHGTTLVGENANSSKLTEFQVALIWKMRGEISAGKIANQFGVSKKAVLCIHHRETWKHVTQGM